MPLGPSQGQSIGQSRLPRAIDDLIFCPVAHGEGNFQVKDEATLKPER
jgi:phosphoribosylformylglycinamidine (FGAM) synthase-like amidotransferase family enzyme